jgi:serine/threonine protein kinase
MAGQLPEMPKQYSRELVDLLRQMLHQDPSKRPTCSEILGSSIILRGLNGLQQKLSKNFGAVGGNESVGPKSTAPASRRPSSQQPMDETASEIGPGEIPEWLRDNQNVQEELVRQNDLRLEKDGNHLLGVVRNSISRMSIRNLPVVAQQPKLTGNLRERKRKLEEDARRAFGEKYKLVYDFITRNGQENREELCKQLGIKGDAKIPETEFHMVETLTAIEACE